MSDIPPELCWDILLRLPAYSLLRFKCVCKSWLGIIDDPSFIKAHTNNQRHSNTLLLTNKPGDPLYSLCLDSLIFNKGPQLTDMVRVKELIVRGVKPLQQDNFYIASCDGLILIAYKHITKMWTVWNPMTGECRRLPVPSAFGLNSWVFGFGFGYDRDSDDYKAVRIYKSFASEEAEYPTLVYSLKSGSWRVTESCPGHPSDNRGTFLNGTLYWRSADGMVALDLGTERYCQLPLPTQVIPRFEIKLDALDGCLICTLNYWNKRAFEGWVMIQRSWIKLFSLQYSVANSPPELKLVAYLKSKGQVILQRTQGFLWFDIRNNSTLKFSIHDMPHSKSFLTCPGTLVRLNGRSATKAVTTGRMLTRNMKRKRDAERKDTRLKICVRDVGERCCSDNQICSEVTCRCCREE